MASNLYVWHTIVSSKRTSVGRGSELAREQCSSGHPEIFVIGDLACIPSHQPPVPGIAPAAKQMGRLAAKNILRRMEGKEVLPFRYRDYGTLATIGRNAAVGVIGRVWISDYPAWLMWLLAHIYFLIDFRNRLVVMIDWA